MTEKKFDPKKLEKLNNPQRLKDIPPAFIREFLHCDRPETLVEIGAGTAYFSMALLLEFGASRLYACDLSDTMLDWVRENIVPRHPEIIPVKTTETTTPLEDGIADLLFMIHLHHELESPPAILEESRRLLKPGGEILIVDWKAEEMEEGPPLHIRCSETEVAGQLVRAGFINVRTSRDLAKHFMVTAAR